MLIFDNETTIQNVEVTILEDNKQEPDEDFFLVMTVQPHIVKRTTVKVNTPVASVLITGNSLHNLSQWFNLLNILKLNFYGIHAPTQHFVNNVWPSE